MTLQEELALDVAAAIGGYESTFTWTPRDADGEDLAPVTLACVRRDSPTRLELQDACGDIEDFRFWLVVAKSAFPLDEDNAPIYPAFGDEVNNHGGQVKTITGLDNAAAVVLTLGIGTADR